MNMLGSTQCVKNKKICDDQPSATMCKVSVNEDVAEGDQKEIEVR